MVQHGTAPDYQETLRNKISTTKYNKNYHNNNQSGKNTIKSTSSTSSDTEPFYLHPPSKQGKDNLYRRNSSPPDAIYGTVLPNDGLYVNPMRTGFHTPPSPSGSVSSESFYLHNPQEVIYNRVKDLFDSDGSLKDGSVNGNQNALTVQAQVHSSSSGAGSGSEESLSGSSVSEQVPVMLKRANSSSHNHEHHDYEDIYLVREEARGVSKGKFGPGRSRSRDSGSHSRSASASSAHSTDIIVEYTTRNLATTKDSLLKNRNVLKDSNRSKYDIPRKSSDPFVGKNINYTKNNHLSNNNSMKNTDMTYESVCDPEDVLERTQMAQRHTIALNNRTSDGGGSNNNRLLKRVVSAPIGLENKGELVFLAVS